MYDQAIRILCSTLSQDLLTSNESITVPPRKRRKIQAEDTFEDYALCLAEAAQVVSTVEQSYATFDDFKGP